MKIVKGQIIKAKLENYKKFHYIEGIIDEVFENGSYLDGTWYAVMVTGGDTKSKLVEMLASERIVVVIPERNIIEVVENENA